MNLENSLPFLPRKKSEERLWRGRPRLLNLSEYYLMDHLHVIGTVKYLGFSDRFGAVCIICGREVVFRRYVSLSHPDGWDILLWKGYADPMGSFLNCAHNGV